MGDSLFEDVIKLIQPVKALVEEATSYVEFEVKTVLQHRITDKKRIEKLLDQLLNYAGMSDKADNLFKHLCNFCYFIYPVMVSEWIVTYRDMYGNAEIDADFVYNNDERKLQVFGDKEIRKEWNEDEQDWYVSIVDVVGILTDQPTPRGTSTYWAVMKKRLIDEGADQLLTNCKQLKMKAADGRMRMTDVANTKEILRIIQSIPSPKAEPFKMWLAQLGKEHIDEVADPEIAIDRAFQTYLSKGYSERWINQRIKTMEDDGS